MIYMGLWHVNDAREPCLPSIFMNNCVRGAVEMEGGGGGTATRPPKVSRARSLDGRAAEASSSHACRHVPTCSFRLVTFPERRSMITNEQRNNMLRSGYLLRNYQTLTSHSGYYLHRIQAYRLQHTTISLACFICHICHLLFFKSRNYVVFISSF